MHGTEPVLLQIQRQAPHPVQNVARLRIAGRELVQEPPMLSDVLRRLRTKRLAIIGVRHVEVQSVEFVIAHDRLDLARIDKLSNGFEDSPMVRPLVDEVSVKDDLSIRIPVDPTESTPPPPLQPSQGSAASSSADWP